MIFDKLLRRIFPKPPPGVTPFINYADARLTPKRIANLYRMAAEFRRGATELRSLPPKLIIEATNVCNLGCPGCFTGVGENGRVRSAISLEAFQRVMDELGDTLFDVEFYNWGEPFLNKSIFAMIADAHARGTGTTISTNFSVPFDAEKAEQLVLSGLDNLGVSIDGTTQATYEKYRVGGDLALVLKNCRLVAEAKRKFGSLTPRMTLIFHVFKHNMDDVPHVQKMGADNGFDTVSVSRGFTVEGEDWDVERKYPIFGGGKLPAPVRCMFLWQYAVIHNEGGVAPCCASFYQEDDFGRIALRPESTGAGSFREVWNSESFRNGRAAFTSGTRPSGDGPCVQCPVTLTFHDFEEHLAAGKTAAEFDPRFGPDDGHRYFFWRRPKGRDTKKAVKPVKISTAKRAPASAQESQIDPVA
jgi:pyruvate-formate lyase-activating enzyme